MPACESKCVRIAITAPPRSRSSIVMIMAVIAFPSFGRPLSSTSELIDTVCGTPGARTEIVMLRPPGGDTAVELSSFVRPDHDPGSPAMANELGLRSVAFEVDDLRATVDRLAADGYGLVGGVGRYENTWLMAYLRGPEGIIVALAERLA